MLSPRCTPCLCALRLQPPACSYFPAPQPPRSRVQHVKCPSSGQRWPLSWTPTARPPPAAVAVSHLQAGGDLWAGCPLPGRLLVLSWSPVLRPAVAFWAGRLPPGCLLVLSQCLTWAQDKCDHPCFRDEAVRQPSAPVPQPAAMQQKAEHRLFSGLWFSISPQCNTLLSPSSERSSHSLFPNQSSSSTASFPFGVRNGVICCSPPAIPLPWECLCVPVLHPSALPSRSSSQKHAPPMSPPRLCSEAGTRPSPSMPSGLSF